MSRIPESEERHKTNEILGYFASRGNEELSIQRIALDLGLNKKIVGSIASRLAARGIITRRSRGVYVYSVERLGAATVEKILSQLEKTIEKTFGERISEDVGISEIRNRKSISGLEDASRRLRRVIGTGGADKLLRIVSRKGATPSERRYILTKLGISD
ncbi:MAG: hypothetical protein ACE5KV_04910 [Thermoplasmata archaeon]